MSLGPGHSGRAFGRRDDPSDSLEELEIGRIEKISGSITYEDEEALKCGTENAKCGATAI